jgi:hypothetical protein
MLYTSEYSGMVTNQRMRWTGHLTRIGKKETHIRSVLVNLKEDVTLEI